MSNPINSFFLPSLPEEEKIPPFKINAERSILSGKIGRTWTGFFRDWLTTLGLISDPKLKGLSFFQRWANLSTRSFTLNSVDKGYVRPAFFAEKIKQKSPSLLSGLNEFSGKVDPFKIDSRSKISDLLETDKLQIRKWIQAEDVKKKIGDELNKKPEDTDLKEIKKQIQHFTSIKRAYETSEEILKPMIMHLHKTKPDIQSYQSIPASKTEVLQNSVWFSMSAAKSALAEELNKPPKEINFENCKFFMEKFAQSIKNYEELKKDRLAYANQGVTKFINILKNKVEESRRQGSTPRATDETEAHPLMEEDSNELTSEQRREKALQMALNSRAQQEGSSPEGLSSDSSPKSPPLPFLTTLIQGKEKQGKGEINQQQQRPRKTGENRKEQDTSQRPLTIIEEMRLKQEAIKLKEGTLTEFRKNELNKTINEMRDTEELLRGGDQAFKEASEARALRIEESIRKQKEELKQRSTEKSSPFSQDLLRRGVFALRKQIDPDSDTDTDSDTGEWN